MEEKKIKSLINSNRIFSKNVGCHKKKITVMIKYRTKYVLKTNWEYLENLKTFV